MLVVNDVVNVMATYQPVCKRAMYRTLAPSGHSGRKQQPSFLTHVFLVTTVSSGNKVYQTFVNKFAIKVAVIPEVFGISFLIYHVCFNTLHHLSNFKALFSSKYRQCTFSDATKLLAMCCHAGHTNNKHMQVSGCWKLDASIQDIALGHPQPQWVYMMPVKVCQVAAASDKHIGLKMFLRLTSSLCIKIILHMCCFCARTSPRFSYMAS